MTTSAEPSSASDLRALLLNYLDFYRAEIEAAVRALPAGELRTSRLSSGWTPAGLVNHLAFMERRWFQWGFAALDVDEPRGDRDGEDRMITPTDGLDVLVERLHEAGSRTRQIVEGAALTDVAQLGGRFADSAEAPHLQWILLHVLQEYARHAGQLDIVAELAAAPSDDH